MSLDADIRPGGSAVKSAREQENSFKAVPKGWYDVTIVKGEVKTFERGNYKGKRNLNVRVKVVKTAAVAAGREFSVTVPLFSNWNPTAKYPDGYPTNYASFFLALGVSEEQVDAGKGLPGPSEFQGKPLSVYLSVKAPDDWHDEDWNQVDRIKAPTAGTPAAVAEVAGGDIWGTASEPSKAPADDVWATSDTALQAAAESGTGF